VTQIASVYDCPPVLPFVEGEGRSSVLLRKTPAFYSLAKRFHVICDVLRREEPAFACNLSTRTPRSRPIVPVSLPYLSRRIMANSHMLCRAHAVPLPCCAALIHTCHAAPLPFSDSAVSFEKVRVVAGNIRTASPTV
jgi:hypothetical protein